jgi:two-component system cell cycle sensor histidine kinase/response regulator CckA
MPDSTIERLREKNAELRKQAEHLAQRVEELEKAKRDLRDARERLRLMLDALPDLLFELDGQGRIRDFRAPQAELLYVPPPSFLGKRFQDVLPAEAATTLAEAIARARTTGRDTGACYSLPMPTGERWFELSIAATTARRRADHRTVVLVRDITTRRQAEQARLAIERQLLHAQKLDSLGVLAGGVAHDFSNILTAILGNAELALMEVPPDSQARECLVDITTAARRAAGLCRQMLAYSGRGRFVVEPVDLSQLVGEMASLLEVSVPGNATFRCQLAEGLTPIEADATELRQVVMNLAVNAAEAIGDGKGSVSISTGELECDAAYLADAIPDGQPAPGRYVYVEVVDSGSGMDDATLTRIFDPFFTTRFTGRGLGLPAVLGIVRGHRGTIKVNTAPALGSTFRILFPAMAEDAREDAPDFHPVTWRGSGTVLVVDDEEGVRKLARTMLERLGFSVVIAADGLAALDVLRESTDAISCVLLDLSMPQMGGAETFQAMRKLKPGIRVILSSGYLVEQATAGFASRGLAGFVQKPYQLHALASVLERAFAWTPPTE